ncbi:MAG: TIM barrel protein [Candidatus Altiarchaeales archaeon]|nr:TIM barrel protein [Candidatus Altiarchaeales archaeon]MBD3416921.1 TIM barrel protein [Candidatus Altiarchaeales archaeon]
MRVGAMNNPHNDPVEEVRLFKEYGLDYVELTIEATRSYVSEVLSSRDELLGFGLPFTGHMPWCFQFASPYGKVRRAFVEESLDVISAAAEFGIEIMTVHPDFLKLRRKMEDIVSLTSESLTVLCDAARSHGIRICFENFERQHMSTDELQSLFELVPGLGFTLDVGHAVMGAGNIDHARTLIQKFTDRLMNVHLHDNFGERDDHLPLGVGTIDYRGVVDELKSVGYDGGITLEVHSEDRDYIKISRDKLSKLL